MALTLSYGLYTHPILPSVTIARTPVYAATGIRIARIERWTIDGVLHGAGVAAIKALRDSLELAYMSEKEDLKLKSGVTTLNQMTSTIHSRGPTITGPTYPKGIGPEWATELHYRIEVEAEEQVCSIGGAWEYTT